MKYRELKNYKYVLALDESIQTDIYPDEDVFYPNKDAPYLSLTKDGVLTEYTGYAVDGATDPAIDSKNILRGAFIHDGLYQLMRQNMISLDNKDKADRLFQRICIEDGMSSFRAAYIYYAVKYFGRSAAAPTEKEEIQDIILEAP